MSTKPLSDETEGRPSDAEVENVFRYLHSGYGEDKKGADIVRRLLAHTKRLEADDSAPLKTRRIAELEAQLRELQRNALPSNCTRCNGVGAEPPGCPESGPCELCGGWTAHKRLVAGEVDQLRAQLATMDALSRAAMDACDSSFQHNWPPIEALKRYLAERRTLDTTDTGGAGK